MQQRHSLLTTKRRWLGLAHVARGWLEDSGRWFLMVAALAMAYSAASAVAQQVRFAQQRGPYYVGEPMVVQITADGLETGAEPVCKLKGPAPDGIEVTGPQVGQSVSSFTQVINGRVTRRESVNYRFNFVVTAARAGEFSIGPFEFEVGGQSTTVEGTTVRFEKLASDPDMQISISLPDRTIYAGEQIPVTVRWAFAGDIDQVQYAFSNLQIRSPLFDQFTFKDRRPSTQTMLTLATAKGEVYLDAEVSRETQDGREFIVVTGQRLMMADVVGDFDSVPVTCRTKKVTRWGRDLFGDLVARETKPALAAGTPISFAVKPVPLAGRPDSFSGAVGSGFSIDVTANRTVVRVGDPIALDVSVRGDGNLENLTLPPLSSGGGMSEERFHLPEDAPAGTLSGNAKQFKLNVRVKEESVDQIPALAFSWFDPIAQQYQTARSKPIALQVMPAQVVSAGDVVSALPGNRQPERRGDPTKDSVADGATSGLSFVGANLAIERDPEKLLDDSRNAFAATSLIVSLYALGGLAVLAAVVVRRRQQVDPEIVRQKSQQKKWRQQIATAADEPPREALQRVAEALQQMAAERQGPERADADALIAECETRIFAPQSSIREADVLALVDRAIAVADRFMGKR